MSAISAPTEREPGTEPGDELAGPGSPVGVALVTATVLASGVASYDAYVVNVAVPAIGRDLGADVAAIQWTPTSYLLGVAALLLVAGAVADRLGRRRVVTAGLAVMFVGSVLCAVAPSIDALIGARGAVPAFAAPDRGRALPLVEGEATS
jgi:MFS family permease